MITAIPEPDDFIEIGLSLFNFAWDTVATLITDLDDSEYFGVDVQEVSDAFWQASKQKLSTSLAVAQQGVEFLLKGRIASVSPFLLISGGLNEWPKKCDKNNTNFADFRTIDAQDLIKVHNTTAIQRLSDEFIAKYEDLRKKRNSIMHTVDKRIDLHVIDVVTAILSMHKLLFPHENWIQTRREYLKKSPIAELHSTDFVEPRIIWEFSLITELLKPKHMREFFEFNKRQRRYICPHCNHESGEAETRPRTAILAPNTPSSTTLYCFVCELEMDVKRMDCEDPECPGNVISQDHEICATCGRHLG